MHRRTGGTRSVEIAPGANLPADRSHPRRSRSSSAWPRSTAARSSSRTGTNHSRYTVDGRVSDHADGHAVDLGMAANGGSDDSPVGDRLMAACLIAGGLAPEQAADIARAGGLYTLEHDGLRVQCIWKTDEGGNHHDHVHAGARPLIMDPAHPEAATSRTIAPESSFAAREGALGNNTSWRARVVLLHGAVA